MAEKSWRENFNLIPAGRPLYIWGAHGLGINVCRSLEARGRAPAAFIDGGAEFTGGLHCGYPVVRPADFLAAPPKEAFVITAIDGRLEESAALLRGRGLIEGADFLSGDLIRPYAYNIDVSGACNLKCVSCPRGNVAVQPKAGFMSPELFERTVAKIKAEDPEASAVFLFIWGDPLMHPQLPRLIEICRAAGLRPLISTNLKEVRHLEATMKSAPPWIKVSASGFGPDYERTHTGADWSRFEAHLRLLSRLKAEYAPDTEVEMAYHLYRHNLGEQRLKMKALCGELGIVFRDIAALVQPLEEIMKTRGRPWSREAGEAMEMLLLPADEAFRRAEAEKDLPCDRFKEILIGWDGQVSICCAMFGPENILDDDFMKITLDEIYEKRLNSDLCRRCRESGTHMFQRQYQLFPWKNWGWRPSILKVEGKTAAS
ncbi:hypothetical protein C4J81_18645 (plasmid) [Deltaproteobacteria bacterium Smac51]|nr:hypothetical protein C4J81_18645 [Deltaproteobacteria bacterium Smac51]